MGRASTRADPVRFVLEPRPIVSYVGHGSVTVKKFYFIPAPAQVHLDGRWDEHPFPLFFSLKMSKKKT